MGSIPVHGLIHEESASSDSCEEDSSPSPSPKHKKEKQKFFSDFGIAAGSRGAVRHAETPKPFTIKLRSTEDVDDHFDHHSAGTPTLAREVSYNEAVSPFDIPKDCTESTNQETVPEATHKTQNSPYETQNDINGVLQSYKPNLMKEYTVPQIEDDQDQENILGMQSLHESGLMTPLADDVSEQKTLAALRRLPTLDTFAFRESLKVKTDGTNPYYERESIGNLYQ